MKPTSLVAIALDLIADLSAPGPYPADARVGRFFRQRRFLGSHDRRFIGDAAYAWLRHFARARARWSAWPPASGVPADSAESARTALLLDILALARDGLFPWSFEELAGAVRELLATDPGAGHPAIEAAARGDFLDESSWPADPLERFAAETSLPAWLAQRVIDAYGEERARRMAAAFSQPAPVDLRVNLRRCDRERARKRLVRDTGAEVELTHFSPLGLRLAGRRNLTGTLPSREGWIEVQDEGSQIAVLAAGASPGMAVIDACAGSGGKTLALADLLIGEEESNPAEAVAKTRILACDVESRKLAELRRRAKDAGLSQRIEYVLVGAEGELKGLLPQAHLVLVDAPCTGLGTLRRNPELAHRWTEEDAGRFHALQRSLLERFAPLVRPRGRLVYITCSFLPEECEDVARAFEAAHPEFEPSPSHWASVRLPASAIDGHRIRIDPLVTGTDAFFIASWRRRKESETGAEPPPGEER